MLIGDIIKLAKKRGYQTADKMSDYNGYEVYELGYLTSVFKSVHTGVPRFILVQNNEARFSTDEESWRVYDSLYGD